jgi:hypothetical protein
LQKSKVATVGISGENLKREEIDDSYSVSPATEVAYEFSVRRRGLSLLYTKTEPAALGNFDTFCKTTFASVSPPEADGTWRDWHVRFVTCAAVIELFAARNKCNLCCYDNPAFITDVTVFL